MYTIKYTNRHGKEISRSFYSWDDIEKWIEILDKRITESRCGGYTITEHK